MSQPSIAVDYNLFMGAVDNFNHLVQASSCRRPGQLKWTKKMIEWLMDLAQVNAYLIWKSERANQRDDKREHEHFINELCGQLCYIAEKVHRPVYDQTSVRCAWRGCQARPYKKRTALAKVSNLPAIPRKAFTTSRCEDCEIALCTNKTCWDDYHNELQLPTDE